MAHRGAKAEMARLQGRGGEECVVCYDDTHLTTCGSCGDTLCRDCKVDHKCVEDSQPKPGIKGGVAQSGSGG